MSAARHAALVLLLQIVIGCGTALADATIAYNPESGALGWAFDYWEMYDAEARAVEECGQGCYTVEWVRDSCAALAARGGEPGWFAVSGPYASKQAAQSGALRACGEGCEVKAWVCD